MKKLVGVTEVARSFDVSRETVYNWIARGCPCYEVKWFKKLDLGEVEQWVMENNTIISQSKGIFTRGRGSRLKKYPPETAGKRGE
jgi:predicted DNA-binding protein YlxM (UPF0122 family)